MNCVDRFANWFRYDLSDFDFLWNIFMIACHPCFWLICMILYYWIFVDKRKRGNQ